MPTLTRKEVEEIAQLARLHLEPDELERMQDELGTILAHVAALAQVPTGDVPPMTHAVATTALRDDTPAPSLAPADALRAVPKREGDLIVVPAIIPGGQG